MGTQKTREFKICWMSNKVRSADIQGQSLNKDKLLNQFCLETFSTMRTGREILDILIKSGKVYDIEGDVLGEMIYSDLFLKKNVEVELKAEELELLQ